MGFLGGDPAYWFLKHYYPQGFQAGADDGYLAGGRSKLTAYFGEKIFDELSDKTVLDFGCGGGTYSLELAAHGCRDVIGLDIQEGLLEQAREAARQQGLDGRVRFTSTWEQPVDVVLSTDAFEHFDDPGAILRQMHRLLKPTGYALIEFGYTWYHPLGGHLFSVFPWAHLLFTERALLRWRSDFKDDGARSFREVAGGLNQMTLRRWERLVAESGFRFAEYELHPIRRLRPLHNTLTREFLTSHLRARLVRE